MLKNFTFYCAINKKIMAQITNISKFHINVNVSNNANLTITYTPLNSIGKAKGYPFSRIPF